MIYNKTNTFALQDNTEVDVYYVIEVPRDCTTQDEIDIEYEYDEAGLTEQQIVELEDIIAQSVEQYKINIIEG
jgi:hypothetical protein